MWFDCCSSGLGYEKYNQCKSSREQRLTVVIVVSIMMVVLNYSLQQALTWSCLVRKSLCTPFFSADSRWRVECLRRFCRIIWIKMCTGLSALFCQTNIPTKPSKSSYTVLTTRCSTSTRSCRSAVRCSCIMYHTALTMNWWIVVEYSRYSSARIVLTPFWKHHTNSS